jgi:mannose-1-phosphate guanylyltransferase
VWDLGDHDTDGNVSDRQAVFVDAERNLVRDFSSKPRTVALVGVEDLCVVQTDDALLIVPRQRSQEVRLVVEQLQALGLQTLL